MAFTNEFISEEDLEKYGIREINLRFNKSSIMADWTVDHDRDIYLRKLLQGRDEFCDQYSYHLYWKGVMIYLKVAVQGGQTDDNIGLYDYKLLKIEIPESVAHERDAILDAIKEALTQSSGGGVYRTITSCKATFDF